MIFMETFDLRTHRQVEMIDITHFIRRAIDNTDKSSGLCTIFVPHTTAAVTINENSDPAVQSDMLKEINKIIPLDDEYLHLEGNSAAHLKATLFGNSETIVIENNKPLLGTWQGIYFCEFDGPRQRKFHVSVL